MLYDKRITLDPRLSMIADMLGVCEYCADIGSDHGRLGAFLLQNERCARMCLSDISDASLQKARKLIALLGLEKRVDFCVGDGALALNRPVDAAVIAGMGGETIAHILETAQGRLDGARLLLQPNVAAEQLRTRMNRAGWRIVDENLVRDGRRIYLVMEARQGAQRLSEMEATVGPVLLQKKPPLLNDYCAFKLRVLRKAVDGANRGADADDAALLSHEIKIWEEAASWL